MRPPFWHRQERLAAALRAWLEARESDAGAAPAADGDAELVSLQRTLQPLLDRWRDERRRLDATVDRLHAVLHSVDSAILAVSADHRRLYANPAAEALFALPAGESAFHRLATLQRYPLLIQWIDAVAAGEPPVAGRLSLPDERTLQVYVTPLGSGSPWPPAPEAAAALPPSGCVVVARDITETVRLETARRDFIAAISHELRTPLTSIQGYAEILQGTPDLPRETRDQFLSVMLENTSRLTRLARDLVTLSSLETGTYPFHFGTVDAAALVGPALDVVSPLAAEHGCRLRIEAVAPASLHADAEALHRVLLNLLENAIVHGTRKPGGARAGIDVMISGQVRQGEYVFTVSDTGAGIASSDQPRVFERFYRVERSGSPHRGTGLGLALVKHIVRDHGGRVELSSVLGEGSTFEVWLPLAAPPAEAAVDEPVAEGAAPYHGQPGTAAAALETGLAAAAGAQGNRGAAAETPAGMNLQ